MIMFNKIIYVSDLQPQKIGGKFICSFIAFVSMPGILKFMSDIKVACLKTFVLFHQPMFDINAMDHEDQICNSFSRIMVFYNGFTRVLIEDPNFLLQKPMIHFDFHQTINLQKLDFLRFLGWCLLSADK